MPDSELVSTIAMRLRLVPPGLIDELRRKDWSRYEGERDVALAVVAAWVAEAVERQYELKRRPPVRMPTG